MSADHHPHLEPVTTGGLTPNMEAAIDAAAAAIAANVEGCEQCARVLATKVLLAGADALLEPWAAEVRRLAAPAPNGHAKPRRFRWRAG